MAFQKNPLTDGEKQKLSVYSNDLETRIANEVNATIQTFSTLSPVTGSLRAIRIGDMVYLSGSVKGTANGDRIANMGTNFAPKGANIYPTCLGGYVMVNTSGVLISYGGSSTLYLDGIVYYVGD